MKTKFILLIAFALTNVTYGQFATNILVSNAGGEGTAMLGQDEYIVTWSIGEPIVETFTINSHTVFTGFQEPIIWVSIFENPEFKEHVKAFPNPTKGIVTLDKSEIHEELLIEISNLHQKVIRCEPFVENRIELDFSVLPVGVYLIKIVSQSTKTHIQTLKIERIY